MGIDVLKHATETSPDNRLCWLDEESGEFVSYKILDREEFAKDVVRALCEEQEDGTTPVHILLDNAMVRAIEDGSIAISEEPSIVEARSK